MMDNDGYYIMISECLLMIYDVCQSWFIYNDGSWLKLCDDDLARLVQTVESCIMVNLALMVSRRWLVAVSNDSE